MSQSIDKRSILIVEDEAPMSRLLAETFRKEGFFVETERNGEDGLKNAIKNRPDIIVLDIIMPRMSGLAMLKRLRKNSWGSGVPVIFLTNLSDPEKIVEATKSYYDSLSVGAFDYLIKTDVEPKYVTRRVKEMLAMVA